MDSPDVSHYRGTVKGKSLAAVNIGTLIRKIMLIPELSSNFKDMNVYL